jgi:zinc protease
MMKKLNRNIKPLPSDKISFTLPDIQQFETDNNLKVILVEKHNLPLLRFNLVVNTGSRYDPVNKKGLANLFAMTIDEGAGDLNALDLSDEFDLLGSNFDSSSSNDAVFLSLRFLKENFQRSFDLFCKIIKEPHLYPKDFEREKRKVMIRLLQRKDDPEEIAEVVFERILFEEENPYSYSAIGNMRDVENITINDINNYYGNFFLPNHSALIVVGDITADELKNTLHSRFKEWRQGDINSINIPLNGKNKKQVYLVNKKDAVQTEIRIGHRISKRNNGDYFSKSILNMILGGQFSSRINLNLREDKGYTYGAFSRLNYYADDAFFHVSTSVAAENTFNAITEIIFELNKIREGIREDELDFAKSSSIRKFPSNFETNRQIALNLTSKIIHNLPDDYFNTYLDKIRDITIDEVNKSALDTIKPEEAVILVVGDKKKLNNQLKDLNLAEIIELDDEGLPLEN